jgi:hypothetical protein
MIRSILAVPALCLAATTSALAHQTGMPHTHPHSAGAFTMSEFIIVALLALAAVLLFGARFFLTRPRKAPQDSKGDQ